MNRIWRLAHKFRHLARVHIVYLLLNVVLVLGGYITTTFNGLLWDSIGASIIATGITGWALFIHVWLKHDGLAGADRLRQLGIADGFGARSVMIKAEYESRLERVTEHVDVMGFGLRHFREDFERRFADLKKRARVRILLIDPLAPSQKYSYAEQRSSEENHQRDTEIADDVRAFLSAIKGVCDDRFEVRLYTCLPSINMFRIDDEVLWGPYLMGEASRNTPTLIVRRGGLMFERLLEHFERIWQNADWSHAPQSPE